MKLWVKKISRARGMNDQLVQEANAKIFTFGSYRLGVNDFLPLIRLFMNLKHQFIFHDIV